MRLVQHPLPVTALGELIRLDCVTGLLYWRHRDEKWFSDGKYSAERAASAWNSRYAGEEAISLPSKLGYRQGPIFRRMYRAHRVVFALFHGSWPGGQIDHRDGDPSNNRPDNLREATPEENMRNRRGWHGSSSRFKGVHWYKAGEKWSAYCYTTAGRQRHLGYFTDEIEAARAYDAFAHREHGEFARLNFPNEARHAS